jgi:hypothetical protein
MFTEVQIILGITLTNEKCIHEEIKSKLNLDNVCSHAVQNLLLPICHIRTKFKAV